MPNGAIEWGRNRTAGNGSHRRRTEWGQECRAAESERQLSLRETFVPQIERQVRMRAAEDTDDVVLAYADTAFFFVGAVSAGRNKLKQDVFT